MQRKERLEQDVKYALSKIITEEVKNSKVKGLISVTDVKITPDEKYATIFVSIYNVKDRNEVLDGINAASKFIRGKLSIMVKMRNTPELTFKLDSSMEYGEHMDKIIKSLNITKDENTSEEE